jgi:hypothetical protein
LFLVPIGFPGEVERLSAGGFGLCLVAWLGWKRQLWEFVLCLQTSSICVSLFGTSSIHSFH